jgi:OmpR-family two-component system manganese-sensing sensor histidine kinase
LGLAITRRIIQNHNGAIAVQSELQRGTTFTILLPLLAKV